jgi:hypothetical protein
MGITFKKLYNRLLSSIDVIPVPFAKEAINQALRHIYDERDWGFLWTTGYIQTPVVINGHASVEKYSPIVNFDLETQLQLNALVVGSVPLEERQIKFFGTNKISRNIFYNFVDYSHGTGIAILDKPFLDDTNANIQIQILKVYYTAPYYLVDGNPEIDFRRWEYIFSPLWNKRINDAVTLNELDRYDPRRTYTGYPGYFVPNGVDSANNILYEFYPHPVQDAVYETRYLRNGQELINDADVVPTTVFSVELILAKAKQKAYEWAIANASKKDIKGSATAFVNLIGMLENRNSSSSYPSLLEMAIKKDEELFPQAYQGEYTYYDVVDYFNDYDWSLPHDRLGDTLVIDANAPSINFD